MDAPQEALTAVFRCARSQIRRHTFHQNFNPACAAYSLDITEEGVRPVVGEDLQGRPAAKVTRGQHTGWGIGVTYQDALKEALCDLAGELEGFAKLDIERADRLRTLATK